jgi:hypothetical protein
MTRSDAPKSAAEHQVEGAEQDGTEDLADRLKSLADKVGCAANAPLENLEGGEDQG